MNPKEVVNIEKNFFIIDTNKFINELIILYYKPMQISIHIM